MDGAVRAEGDPVIWLRQVLGGQPEVHGVLGDVAQRPGRRELGLERFLAAEHLRLRLADHLDVAHRVVEVRAAEVEVIDAEGLLEDGRVRVLGQGEHGLAVVVHEVAADLIGAVGQPVRVLVASGGQQQLGGVDRAAGDDHDVAVIALGLAVVLGHHLGDRGAGRVGLQLHHPRVPEQGDVGVLEGGADAEHLGLGVQRAREAVAVRAAHADAVGHVRLVDQDAARRVERVIAGLGQVIGELLDPGLVGHRRVRVGRAGRRVGRILTSCAVHLVHGLGGGVVRLHVLVGDGPGGRDAVMVAQFAEVLGAHPVQRGSVQLGGAADEVMNLRLEEGLGFRVVPAVRRDVAAVDEHVHGGPVRRLAGQPVAAFE